MLKKIPGFIARVGAIVLLACLCRSQAQLLMEAAMAGGLPVMGWVLLAALILTGAACTLGLMLGFILILVSLAEVSSGAIGEIIIRKLRDAGWPVYRR